MRNSNTRKQLIVSAILIIAADVLIFIMLGLLLMNYDDHYDPSKGEYWSLASMTPSEKAVYISYNLWIVLNIAGAGYVVYRLYKHVKNS